MHNGIHMRETTVFIFLNLVHFISSDDLHFPIKEYNFIFLLLAE